MSFSTITFLVDLFIFACANAYCLSSSKRTSLADIYSTYHEASNFPSIKYVGKYTQISLITQRLFTLCVYVLCIHVRLPMCLYV